VFVLGWPFQPSLIFESKAGACQGEVPFSGLTRNFKTTLKIADDKRTSLFCLSVGDEEKEVL
jgi:hypothetical protein